MSDEKSSQSDYVQVSTSVIDGLSSVRLYDETWDDHISDGHPEVAVAGKDAIISTVATPTVVYKSATRPEDSVVFVNDDTTRNGDPLHVAVKKISGTNSGRVTTAVFRQSSSGWDPLWKDTDG